MNFSIKNLFPKDGRTRQNLLVAVLVVLSLVGFMFIYNAFFKTVPAPPQAGVSKLVSGEIITSSESSAVIINKIKRDIDKMKKELDNPFYSNLKKYESSGEIIIKPGRKNPFISTF